MGVRLIYVSKPTRWRSGSPHMLTSERNARVSLRRKGAWKLDDTRRYIPGLMLSLIPDVSSLSWPTALLRKTVSFSRATTGVASGRLTTAGITQGLWTVRSLSPFWGIRGPTVCTQILPLQSFPSVNLLCALNLLLNGGRINIAIDETALAHARAKTMRPLALAVTQPCHHLNSVDVGHVLCLSHSAFKKRPWFSIIGVDRIGRLVLLA